MTDKKTTVGAEALKLMARPDEKQGVIDTQREMNKKYIPSLEECIKNHSHWTEPFYVVVINKRERLIVNAIRQYFLARQTLPRSDYDQTVFKYDPKNGDLRFLWTVPDIKTVDYLIVNAVSISNEEKELLHFCQLFKAEKLEEVCGL